jgi:hypothetical protein
MIEVSGVKKDRSYGFDSPHFQQFFLQIFYIRLVSIIRPKLQVRLAVMSLEPKTLAQDCVVIERKDGYCRAQTYTDGQNGTNRPGGFICQVFQGK